MSEIPNWFNLVEENFRHIFPNPIETEFHALQLGAFSGDASVWILENLLRHSGSTLTDVDTWQGSDETPHHELDFSEVEALYDERVAPFRAKVKKNKATTQGFFDTNPIGVFDFIYIDADHTASGVLSDAVRSHPLLKPGGIMAFDDYGWHSGIGQYEEPKAGVDAFLSAYGNKYLVLGVGWQFWLRKL